MREVEFVSACIEQSDPAGMWSSEADHHDADRAIEWLRRLTEKHVGQLNTIGTEGEWISVRAGLSNRMACFKNISSDPRYQALQRLMKAENSKTTPH
jgi:hypothetical protein